MQIGSGVGLFSLVEGSSRLDRRIRGIWRRAGVLACVSIVEYAIRMRGRDVTAPETVSRAAITRYLGKRVWRL